MGIWSLSVTSHAQLVSILWYLLLIITRALFLIHSTQSSEECLLHIAHINTLHINTPPQCVNAIRFIKQHLFKSYLSVHQEYVNVSECIATANSRGTLSHGCLRGQIRTRLINTAFYAQNINCWYSYSRPNSLWILPWKTEKGVSSQVTKSLNCIYVIIIHE